jgi:hypothetical protein
VIIENHAVDFLDWDMRRDGSQPREVLAEIGGGAIWIIQKLDRADPAISFPRLVGFLGAGPRKLDYSEQRQRVGPGLRDATRQAVNLFVFAEVFDDFRFGIQRLVPRVFFIKKNAINLDRPKMPSHGRAPHVL